MKNKANKLDLTPLAAAIKAAREEKGESRTMVCNDLGITTAELTAFENKGQHLPIQKLYDLAVRYNLTFDKFLFGAAKAPTTSITENKKSATKKAEKPVPAPNAAEKKAAATKKSAAKKTDETKKAATAKPVKSTTKAADKKSAAQKKPTTTTKTEPKAATTKKPAAKKAAETKKTTAKATAAKGGRKKTTT